MRSPGRRILKYRAVRSVRTEVELDWLVRMQEADGSVLHKVSVTSFAAASPPSADVEPRRWAEPTASATISAAGVLAHAASVYGGSADPVLQAYAATLETAALAAWDWLEANPGRIPSSYDNQGFVNAAAGQAPACVSALVRPESVTVQLAVPAVMVMPVSPESTRVTSA